MYRYTVHTFPQLVHSTVLSTHFPTMCTCTGTRYIFSDHQYIYLHPVHIFSPLVHVPVHSTYFLHFPFISNRTIDSGLVKVGPELFHGSTPVENVNFCTTNSGPTIVGPASVSTFSTIICTNVTAHIPNFILHHSHLVHLLWPETYRLTHSQIIQSTSHTLCNIQLQNYFVPLQCPSLDHSTRCRVL